MAFTRHPYPKLSNEQLSELSEICIENAEIYLKQGNDRMVKHMHEISRDLDEELSRRLSGDNPLGFQSILNFIKDIRNSINSTKGEQS